MKKIKAVALVLIMILCGAAFARGMQVEAKANAVQEKLSGEVFRFHVLANSDSKEDQELKMKVKEAVVDYMCENLSNAGNAAEAKAWAIRHKEELIRTAREVLQEEGCNDQITAEVVRCEFPDKTYGDIITWEEIFSPSFRLNIASHSFTPMDNTRIRIDTRLNFNSSGSRIFMIAFLKKVNPTSITRKDTISAAMYSSLPCPKGCSLSAGFSAIFTPIIPMIEEPASDKLLNASAVTDTL